MVIVSRIRSTNYRSNSPMRIYSSWTLMDPEPSRSCHSPHDPPPCSATTVVVVVVVPVTGMPPVEGRAKPIQAMLLPIWPLMGSIWRWAVGSLWIVVDFFGINFGHWFYFQSLLWTMVNYGNNMGIIWLINHLASLWFTFLWEILFMGPVVIYFKYGFWINGMAKISEEDGNRAVIIRIAMGSWQWHCNYSK